MNEELTLGGVSLSSLHAALRARVPAARAFYAYDLGGMLALAQRVQHASDSRRPLIAYALKANPLHALIAPLAQLGLGADAASLGELEMAAAAGFGPERRVLNGNGKTPEEIAWAARQGVALVNADHVAELDALESAAAREERSLRVALRVNPGIAAPVHRHVRTAGEGAKFGVSPEEALEAWSSRARWPHLMLDGLHLHIGSQILDLEPPIRALEFAWELIQEAERRSAPLGLLNLGGGFGVDPKGRSEFPIQAFAHHVLDRLEGTNLDLVLEPGRYLVARIGVLVSEVLWIKQRDGVRFVVLAAGMNDLLRPALYGARHRIVPVRPRAGKPTPATVVGPVCETADTFARGVRLPPLEPGDLVALLDAGAYGASMASNYNGRGRLAELVVEGGRVTLASLPEGPGELLARQKEEALPLPAPSPAESRAGA
jgi:diaminopimelate decarboxylase